ncbi:uncharacterized protein DUF4440 [Kribbella antiqua]|uniref:Uncharacterized protein DUF4440 n=1 Tax=Kribbella antiqua TaxID=2512217 RepID=A0A4V2S3U2_9ACTN|nr:nuclear transport factor 2 family protein [Kribbella antiqua]TCO45710.1 uncharacterized protein DUF4440 [Kribbella antiqua]
MRRGLPRWAKAVVVGVGVVVAALVLAQATGYSVSLRSSVGDRAAVTSLQEIELQRMQALVAADMRYLEHVFAPDYESVPPPGIRLTRQSLLESVADGSLDFIAFEPLTAIEVRLHDGSAVLWYRSSIDILAAEEGRFTHEMWLTLLYEKQDGRWQLVHEQATAVGGFPPPTQS